ncbi:MAG: hypothetical protein IJA12_03590 [Oscillospiraceae bacterium]|nr:hypothetical protein [Oscillospiraceae bacterium]
MKKTIKNILAVLAAVSVIGTASVSVSAATADDVVAAARGAGFLEEYVQMLQNYLNVTKFTSEQYDILVGAIAGAGSEMDDVAMQYFGKTVAELKGAAQEEADKNNTEFDDSFLVDIADKMTDDNMVEILDQMVEAGKELGLDVTVEKKDDKNYVLTVKDADGNVQLVTPVGKLVDRTGVIKTESNGSSVLPIACAGSTAIGIAGALAVTASLKKNEE